MARLHTCKILCIKACYPATTLSYTWGMEAVVLGTGPSIKLWKPDGRIVFGVNDVGRFASVDYLVCIDRPGVFTPERLEVIKGTACKEFITPYPEWEGLNNSYKKIEISGRGRIDLLDAEKIIYSNNSTFVAAVLAYRYGARNITLYGVDFTGHPVFSLDHKLARALRDFEALYKALKNKGIGLYVASEMSKLAGVLPVVSAVNV